MKNEKSLLEEILNVKDKKIKNRLLDNDDMISSPEDEKIQENINQSKLNNNEKIQNEKLKRKKIIRKFFKNRKMKKISFTPYIRTEVDVRNIMKDVIIALFPAIIAAWLVFME